MGHSGESQYACNGEGWDKLNVMGTRSLTKWIAESHRSELVTFGTKEVGSHRRPPEKKKKKKKVE